jgi:predicted nucleic acid-binding protein
MRFVLDASIAVNWAMRDEDHLVADAAFRELRTGSATAPGIWWYEVRNILIVSERRNRIDPTDSAQLLTELHQLSIEMEPDLDSSFVMELSRTHRITVYDASYLALAIRERLPLATLDKALQAAAQASGVSLLT